jgi:hypothetical protein
LIRVASRCSVATGQQCRLTANGTLAPVSTSDNGPDDYSDYALPVDGSRTLSVPLAISLSGSSQQSAGRLRDGGRAAVFSALRAQPAFANLGAC